MQNARPMLAEHPGPVTAIEEDPLTEEHTTKPVLFGHSPLSAAFRFIQPTWRNYIMYVDMEARENNADAKRYLDTYQSLPKSEQRSHLPEQICSLASVAASDLVSWVTRQVWVEGSAKANMCMSFMRDRVLERVGEFAIENPENYKHAELFMKVSGMMPATGRQGGVNIFNVPVASSNAIAGAKSESAASSPAGLRGMDEEIVELSRIMQMEADTPKIQSYMEDDDEDEEDDEEEDEE